MLKRLLADLGTLRCLLMLAVLLSISAAPFADGTERLRGLMIVPTVLGPTVMMILMFVLPLDMVMSRVFMLDSPPERRARLKRVILTELVAFAALLGAWLPFIRSVLDLNPLD
mgnify:FL=1